MTYNIYYVICIYYIIITLPIPQPLPRHLAPRGTWLTSWATLLPAAPSGGTVPSPSGLVPLDEEVRVGVLPGPHGHFETIHSLSLVPPCPHLGPHASD